MKILFTLCLLFFTIQIHTQTFTNYTTDDGLINNSVNALTVDVDNKMWFGTQEGLSHFDGTSWTNYDQTSHPGLVDNNIKALAVDSDNNLWIGTDFGISKFDGTTWTTYTDDDGLADNRVKYIKQSADGRMWFANNDGISILDGDTWTSYVMADGIPFGGTNYVTFDSDGNAWLGTPLAGILIFDGTDFTAITEDEGLLSDKVRSIEIAANGLRWIGTADGVSVFDANNVLVEHHEIIFELPPPDLLNPVEDVKIGQEGRIWVGVYVDYLVTEGGVTMYANETWTDYDVDDGLVGPVVRRLAIDQDNIVWVATSTGITKIGDLPSPTFEIEINSGISIFPNPVINKLIVEVPTELLDKEYQIFDAVGKLVKTGRITDSIMNLTVENMTTGFYVISIEKVYNRKFVKAE